MGDFSMDRLSTYAAHFRAHVDEDDETTRERSELPEFFNEICEGVLAHLESIDHAISLASTHWSLARMALVDRNILRIAVYEMLHRSDVPPKVCINEAIEVAKRFAAPESSVFINGVLDKVAQQTHVKSVGA
jgi:transcription antitermination factor NusB